MPAPNNTIYALTEEVRRLPDNSLITNLQNHSGSIPSWVLLGEVERRKALRDGATASNVPEGTVAKDAIAGLQAISNQTPPAPQPQIQAPQGGMQPQAPVAAMAGGGGIRSLAEGGGIEDELKAGDEAAQYYASQVEQEDDDSGDDVGNDDDGDLDDGAEDYGADDASPEDDEEPLPDDSEDEPVVYARGGRVKKKIKRLDEGGEISGETESGSRELGDIASGANGAADAFDSNMAIDNPGVGSGSGLSGLTDTLSGASPAQEGLGASLMSGLSSLGNGVVGFAKDPRGTYNDFMSQPYNPSPTGNPADAQGAGSQPSYLDYTKAPPPPMPIVMAAGGSINERLLRPASGPPVPILQPGYIEGPPGVQPQAAQMQAPQGDQERMDRIKQLRLQASMDGRQNSMRRKDPRYGNDIAGQFGLDPKDIAGRLQADSMKKGGVVRFAEGGLASDNLPPLTTEYVPTDSYSSNMSGVADPSFRPRDPYTSQQQFDDRIGRPADLPAVFGGKGYPGDPQLIFDKDVARKIAEREQWLKDDAANTSDPGWEQDALPGSGGVRADVPLPLYQNVSSADDANYADQYSGIKFPSNRGSVSGANGAGGGPGVGIPSGGGQGQAGGMPQSGMPGAAGGQPNNDLTVDSIFKAQMDAIKDRTEDRKSAQERANNDALIAMGAAMMGAKGPNALAALGEGLNAGTAARKATMATSEAIAQQNMQNRHAIATAKIAQDYHNGTISARQALAQQTALRAALGAASSAAGRANATVNTDKKIAASLLIAKGRADQAAGASDNAAMRSNLNAAIALHNTLSKASSAAGAGDESKAATAQALAEVQAMRRALNLR